MLPLLSATLKIAKRAWHVTHWYINPMIFSPNSPLFDGDLPTRPTTSIVYAELETHLSEENYKFQRQSQLKTTTIIDFMSKVRQIPNLSSFNNVGDAVSHVFSGARSVCPSDEIHVIFDSYSELYIKDCERLRRAGITGSVDLAVMDESVPIPQQTDKFWTSSKKQVEPAAACTGHSWCPGHDIGTEWYGCKQRVASRIPVWTTCKSQNRPPIPQ